MPKTATVTKDETRHDAFVRLATKRTNNALDKMDLLLNLATGNYESTPEERQAIINVLSDKIVEIDHAFNTTSKSMKVRFSL